MRNQSKDELHKGGIEMNRYVIKFSKVGNIRFISHLDLLRLFKRSFKRAGIKLVHSQGFNPHPKMSFAQPLSLGYTSSAEYIEFDTQDPYPTELIREKISGLMPEGIAILDCRELPVPGKSLAALTERASYEIVIPLDPNVTVDLNELVNRYMNQTAIHIAKHQKKSNKDVVIDIKPMIHEIKGSVDNNNIMITLMLAAGSTSNLSPEMVLASFCESAGISYDRAEVGICRIGIFFAENEK
jgi:radical SAM-linked protein